jgi:hypothetical protein
MATESAGLLARQDGRARRLWIPPSALLLQSKLVEALFGERYRFFALFDAGEVDAARH